MKTFVALILAPVALAATLKDYQHMDNVTVEPAHTMPASSNSTGADCGVGYTYCGYILRDQKSTSHAIPSIP